VSAQTRVDLRATAPAPYSTVVPGSAGFAVVRVGRSFRRNYRMSVGLLVSLYAPALRR